MFSLFYSAKKSQDSELRQWGEDNEMFAEFLIMVLYKYTEKYYNFQKWYCSIKNIEKSIFYHLDNTITMKPQVMNEDNVKYEKSIFEYYKDIRIIMHIDLNRVECTLSELIKQIKKLNIVSYPTANNELPPENVPNWIGGYEQEIIFKVCRGFMNYVNLLKIKPDLIILDESHKYFTDGLKNVLNSYLSFLKCYNDEIVKNTLEKSVESYRVSLGYGIKPDVIKDIYDRASDFDIKPDFKKILLDLSPEEKYDLYSNI